MSVNDHVRLTFDESHSMIDIHIINGKRQIRILTEDNERAKVYELTGRQWRSLKAFCDRNRLESLDK